MLSARNYYKKNKDVLNKRRKDHYERNKNRRREKINFRQRKRYRDMKKAILSCKNIYDLLDASEGK